MADRNKNFIRGPQTDSTLCALQAARVTSPGQHIGCNHSNINNNNNCSSTCSPTAVRKDSVYGKRDSIHQRPSSHQSNSIGNHLPRRAPIVGWQNGSPTVFPSSPCKTPDTDCTDRTDFPYRNTTSTSKSTSGFCQDSGNTEDLSSLADDRLLQSTPALTINRSVESLSPDKDTFLTTSPDIGRSKDLSLGDELGDKIDLLSPGTDCTEDKMPPTSTEMSLTSANLTVVTTPSSRSEQVTSITSTNESSDKVDLPLAQKNSADTVITTNPGYRDDDDDDCAEDSIDSDSALGLTDDLDSSSREETRKKPKIPDGGWGWVVVAASLLISMVADGVSFSFGLLYIEFLHEFGASKSKTAWIGSLFMAVPLLSGPVMSTLVDRYGCRNMTILGGLVSGLGFILSSFSNTIEVMYLTFGVLAGLGLGLCYVTAVVSIAYWFDKKRTLAVSLGACGTGIGTFLYAPMTTFFIEEYGWRGTCLLLSGTFFNLIVCGTVMRDPEWWIKEQRKQSPAISKKTIAKSECGRSSGSPADEFPGVEELRRLLKSGQAPEYLLQNLSTSTETPNGEQSGNFRSVVNLPTFVKQSEKVPLEVLESLSSNSRLYSVILENYPNLLMCRSISDKKIEDSAAEVGKKSGVTMSMRLKQARDNSKSSPQFKESRPENAQVVAKVFPAKRMSRKDAEEANPLLAQAMAEAERAKSVSRHHILGTAGVVRTDSLPWLRRQFSTNTHYFKDIRVHRNSVMYRGAALNLNKYRLRASSCPDIYRNSMTTLAKENEEKWYAELVDILKGMMDFSMFLELHFFLLSLSTILLFTWFIVPYFYLAEHLTRNGYTESDAANLLSIIGITNTIGMIGLGWAGDQPWMNVTKTYCWCLVACGVATIFMCMFTSNYTLLMATSAAFGLSFASNFSFTPVILVELIPLERFTTAYGLSLLCQGIGNLLGPPLAGWFFDITDSWELSFFMAGGWIIFSGILIGIIPCTRNRRILGSGPIENERKDGEKEYLA